MKVLRVQPFLLFLVFVLSILSYSLLFTAKGIYASLTNTRASQAGTVELSGSGWLSGQGVDVFSNGDNFENIWGTNTQVTPAGATVTTGDKWQCVELPNRLFAKMGWISSQWSGDGNSMYNEAPASFAKELNTQIINLKPGDAVMMDDSWGGAGHVAVVESVVNNSNGTKAVTMVSQNTQAVYLNSTLTGMNLSSPLSSYSIKGVVHAPQQITMAPSVRGDFNKDGFADLAWYHSSNSTLGTLRSTGSAFAPGTVANGIGMPDWAGVGDFNKDGYSDVAWYNLSNQSISTIMSTGSSFYIGGNTPGIGMPDWAGVGDFNKDGRDDLAWYHGSNSSISIILSTGNGFTVGWVTYGIGMPDWAGVGDFNKDGYDDLAWYSKSNTTITTLLSNGSNGFAGPWTTPGIGMPDWAGVGDFNKDGRDDLAWYSKSNSTIATLLSNGINSYFVGWNTPGIGLPNWAGVGDFNKDGRDDLAWYHQSNSSLTAIKSTGSAFAIGWTNFGIGLPNWAGKGSFSGTNGDGSLQAG